LILVEIIQDILVIDWFKKLILLAEIKEIILGINRLVIYGLSYSSLTFGTIDLSF